MYSNLISGLLSDNYLNCYIMSKYFVPYKLGCNPIKPFNQNVIADFVYQSAVTDYKSQLLLKSVNSEDGECLLEKTVEKLRNKSQVSEISHKN